MMKFDNAIVAKFNATEMIAQGNNNIAMNNKLYTIAELYTAVQQLTVGKPIKLFTDGKCYVGVGCDKSHKRTNSISVHRSKGGYRAYVTEYVYNALNGYKGISCLENGNLNSSDGKNRPHIIDFADSATLMNCLSLLCEW
jgi:hypothetical protein